MSYYEPITNERKQNLPYKSSHCFVPANVTRQRINSGALLQNTLEDLGKQIVDACPPLLCTGLDCRVVTERNGWLVD